MKNKKLYLSTKDVKLTGLCGGFSEMMEVDSTIVRAAFILLSCFRWPLIIAYFIIYI
ncbi:MAG: PspC domain-containing protein [Bacilli bacterium]